MDKSIKEQMCDKIVQSNDNWPKIIEGLVPAFFALGIMNLAITIGTKALEEIDVKNPYAGIGGQPK